MADAKAEWVERVLGLSIGGPGAAASGPMLPAWVAAKDQVDAAIGTLVAALRKVDDPDVLQIAEWGLQKHTNGRSVRLMAALRDADGAGTAQARAKAAQAAQDFHAFLEGDVVVDLLEKNPFGASVPLRRVMGPVLERIIAAG